MAGYIIRRVLFVVVVLFVVTTLTFFLSAVAPSDPALLWAGPRPKAGQIEKIRKQLGLDKPAYVRYYHYLAGLIRGDLGTSIRTHKPVKEDLKKYYMATLELAVVSMVLSVFIGIPLGVFTAFRRETPADHAGRVFSLLGVALPIFWLGMMFQLLFGIVFDILPINGRVSNIIRFTNPVETRTGVLILDSLIMGNWVALKSALLHIILPSFTLAFASLAYLVRITRSAVIEVMGENYIRTAKAFGISDGLVKYKYALKNALIPVVTVLGIAFAMSLAGSILVESIFDWPGLGRYMWQSIINNDFPSLIGVTLVFAVICCTVNLLVDLLYAFIDRRVKVNKSQEG